MIAIFLHIQRFMLIPCMDISWLAYLFIWQVFRCAQKSTRYFLSFRLLVPHLQNTFLRSAVFEKVAQPRHMVSWSSNLMNSWANTAKPIKKHDTMCNLLGSIYSDVQKFEAAATEWSLITELLRTRLNESWQ